MPLRWFFAVPPSKAGLALLAALISQLLLALQPLTAAEPIEPPKVLDPDWAIELVASEPQLVTPISCRFDHRGRLLVVECHTHFPPDDYDGPTADRIYRFEDRDGDGSLEHRELFFEGGSATMGLAPMKDGSALVATRSDVKRIRDTDGDGVADQETTVLRLETPATYPHNGLAGLALGPDGWLYVGQGENLGEAYALVGSDGSRQVGGGEGGNIFRCRPDGSQLERYATGFWNPFGLLFDSAGRLWTVGNDPDAMPPCRLLHVVPAGDYGFQFRFGRGGTHPLQAWNGELPGTLPMAAGTGEAPGAVVEADGKLWVTSWGSNRIERYRLTPNGASWQSGTETLVQGGAEFRPVDMAVAPDGSIYLTDWVDRSYPVHGRGRIWRLYRRDGRPETSAEVPPLSEAEQACRRLTDADEVTESQLQQSIGSDDPFVRQAAVAGLVRSGRLDSWQLSSSTPSRDAVGLITAWRWKQLTQPDSVPAERQNSLIAAGLRHPSTEVRQAAIRWAAERSAKKFVPELRTQLDRPDLSPQLFETLIAGVAYLEEGTARRGVRDPAREALLETFAADPSKDVTLRALAIRLLPAEAETPEDATLAGWAVESSDRRLGGEIVRLLDARGTESAGEHLAALALDARLDPQVRADAAAALGPQAARQASAIAQLERPDQPAAVRTAARRVRLRGKPLRHENLPRVDDLAAWRDLVGSGGDIQAGRRVFFGTTCASCHAHSERGAGVGPDLTSLAGTMSRERIMESILQPSKEVGPLYVPWKVLTTDGRALTGLRLDASGAGKSVQFLDADGTTFQVPLAEIAQQAPVAESIMPAGLQETMSVDEFRDLLAFLARPGW